MRDKKLSSLKILRNIAVAFIGDYSSVNLANLRKKPAAIGLTGTVLVYLRRNGVFMAKIAFLCDFICNAGIKEKSRGDVSQNF